MARDKALWLQVGSEDGQTALEAAGMSFRRTSSFNYLGSVSNDTGEREATIIENIAKAKRRFIRICPFLRSRSLSTSLKAKLVEVFKDLIKAYRLPKIVLRVRDNNRLIALQNTARWMFLGLQSRKEKRAGELKAEIEMNNLTTKARQWRLKCRRSLKNQDPECLILSILKSDISVWKSAKATHSRYWMLQLRKEI